MPKRSKIQIKNNLAKLRQEKNITQNELALILGITRQTIIALEKQRYSPSLVLGMRIAGYFGKRVEEVFKI